MNRSSALLLVFFVSGSNLTCGSGSGRHLESIVISKNANGSEIQFTATGTFSAPPMTVTPLPVDWSTGLFAPPPKQYTYSLTAQPFAVACGAFGSGSGEVAAAAPQNPNAPGTGTLAWSEIVTGASSFTCP